MFQDGDSSRRRARPVGYYAPPADEQTGEGGSDQALWKDLFDGDRVVVERLGRPAPRGKRPMTGDSLTYIVPLGVQDSDDPARWAPGTVPDGNMAMPGLTFGDWLHPLPVFQGGEKKRIAMIVYDPEQLDIYNPDDAATIWELPIMYFRNVVAAAVYDGGREDLRHLVVRPETGYRIGRLTYWDAPLPNCLRRDKVTKLPQLCSVFRGLLLGRGGEVFSPPKGLGVEDRIPLFVLTPPQAPALKLCLVSPLGGGMSEDGIGDTRGMVDPTDLAAPNVLLFYRDGDELSRQGVGGAPPRQPVELSGGYNIVRLARARSDWPDPAGRNPAMLAQYADFLRAKLPPFRQVYQVTAPEAQVRLIAEAFNEPLVRWAFAERPEWLSIAESVWSTQRPAAPVTTGEPRSYPPVNGGPAAGSPPAPAAPAAAYPPVTASPATYPPVTASPATYPPAAAPAATYPPTTAAATGYPPTTATAASAPAAVAPAEPGLTTSEAQRRLAAARALIRGSAAAQ